MSEKNEKLSEAADHPLSNRDPNNKKEWVKFEEEDGKSSPAVLPTESIHVTIENAPKTKDEANQNGNDQSKARKTSQPAVINIVDSPGPIMRTVELSSTERIQEGFVNGEIIVTLLPTNVNWPWITPAVFRPELVPEELMAQGLSLTVEEYVNAMETLTTDYRFTLYNVCYKRVLLCWITLAFCVLLGLLFSGITGVLLFSLGVGWLFLNAIAIFVCMWVKLRLARGLEKCLARVNKLLIRHKIMMALDDRGNISCHKINLCFIYFDPGQCINFINTFLERSEQNGQTIGEGWESRLDIDSNDIIIQGSSNTRVSRKQALAEQVYLRYLQRWGKDFLRHRLDWQINSGDEDPTDRPRHLRTAYCACQYAEEILKSKISKAEDRAKSACCVWINQQMSKNRGELLTLRYAARWGHEMLRGFLKISNNEPARHMVKHICPCQFIECHLKCKPEGNCCWCFPSHSEFNYMYPY